MSAADSVGGVTRSTKDCPTWPRVENPVDSNPATIAKQTKATTVATDPIQTTRGELCRGAIADSEKPDSLSMRGRRRRSFLRFGDLIRMITFIGNTASTQA